MTIYRGLSGVNRELKQQYRGLSGVNREIKEQYRGLSDVNRKVFSSRTILYDHGDEKISLTGGWSWFGALGSPTYSKTSSCFDYYSADGWKTTGIQTENVFNVTNYNYLKVLLDYNLVTNAFFDIMATPSKKSVNPTYGNANAHMDKYLSMTHNNNATGVTLTLDISAVTTNAYPTLVFQTGGTSGAICDASVYNIWLE